MMQNNSRKIWLNGQIVNVEDAKINVLTPTAQFGANVFEGIRCYWNEQQGQLYAFRLKDHYQRLDNSIRLFRIKCSLDKADFQKYLIETVRANLFQEDIAVRQTIFVEGAGSWFSKEPAGMFIAPITKKRKKHPLEIGEKTCVSSWRRISDNTMSPRAKVGANYINSRLAKMEAEDNGYDSAIFLNDLGYVAEGTGSCFFMVKDNILITPKLTDSILDSITRNTVIQIAREVLKIEVCERSINRTELYTCDEAFFCGSAVEIAPIIQFDSFVIGDGKPGKLTQLIHSEYLNIVTGNNDRYLNWLTPIY